MDVSRSEFMAFDEKQVHKFVLEKAMLSKGLADQLLGQEVDGDTLLRSSAQEVKDLFGLPGGPAKRLVDKLAAMFPGEESVSNCL